MKIREFLSEARNEPGTPGISVTNAVHKKSGQENKAGLAATAKNLKDYDSKIKSDKGMGKMPEKKFNYEDSEEEYHNQMEIMNGQEMIEYDREPNKEFKDRAKESMVGSSRMGNKGGKGMGNAEAIENVSSDDFAKNRVKDAAASMKKRHDASKGLISFGDDIETVPKNSAKMTKFSALSEVYNNDEEEEEILEDTPYGTEKEYEFNNSKEAKKPLKTDGDKNKPKLKETMKRLKFKNEIGGIKNALKLIPENYKVDQKVFEMTDGNEKYKMRWEGTMTEGRAAVLLASDNSLLAENMATMKHLMGYKSESTLGTLKGNARIDENAIFNSMYAKAKLLIEGEDIEGQKAKEGDLDDAVSKAPEATKHVQGSVSTDKGFKAPKAKTGSMESLDDAVSQPAEATKHVEGSVETKIGMGLGVKVPEGEWDEINMPQGAAHGTEEKTGYNKAPATGEWDEINVPQANDAKKHISMHEGVEIDGVFYGLMDENFLPSHVEDQTAPVKVDENEEEGDEAEPKDDWNSNDDEDGGMDVDAEPSADQVQAGQDGADAPNLMGDTPAPKTASGPRLMISKTTGDYFLVGAGPKPVPVPIQDKDMAKANPAKYLEKIMADMDDDGNQF